MSHADSYLKSIGVKAVIHALIPHTIVTKPFWNKNIKLLTWKLKDTQKTPDGHGGPKAHEEFAKILAREIANNA